MASGCLKLVSRPEAAGQLQLKLVSFRSRRTCVCVCVRLRACVCARLRAPQVTVAVLIDNLYLCVPVP